MNLYLAAAALTILSIPTPVSSAAITSGYKRVIGGTNENASAEFPFFVQGQGCGASLIWYDVALSSANCEGGYFTQGVFIGNHIRDTVTSGVITRDVIQQVKHPNYNATTLENAFLVLKLSEEVPRNHSFIRLVELNNITSNPAANEAWAVAGFGYTTAVVAGSGTQATNLQKATLYSCGYSSALLCAYGTNASSCFGDAGGPLIDARGVQVGVTSSVDSKNCTGRSYFLRVSAGYSWIRTQICLLSSNPPAYCPTVSLTTSSILEGGSTTIKFNSVALGPPTEGTVDWGDDTVDKGTNTSFTHKYLNGNANYTIKTKFTHSALPTPKQYKEFPMRVRNVVPIIRLSGIPNTTQVAPYYATVFIKCSDPGELDGQIIHVHWNDTPPTREPGRSVPAPATDNCKNLNFTHWYNQGGSYKITADVVDSDGGRSAVASAILQVSGRRGLLRGDGKTQDNVVADDLP